tara:strand:- start:486 stop:701 length:216 start_codon:yes stop_codon:yes gene_type:complete
VKVEVRNNNFDRAISKFKRKVDEEGILQTYRSKQYFEKPSAKRRRLKMEGTLRSKKRQKDNNIDPRKSRLY